MKNYHEEYISRLIKDYFDTLEINQFRIESTDLNFEFNQYGDLLLYFQNELIGIIEIKKGSLPRSIQSSQLKKWQNLVYEFEFYIIICENEAVIYNRNLSELKKFNNTLIEPLKYIANFYLNEKFDIKVTDETKEKVIINQTKDYFKKIFKKIINNDELERISNYMHFDFLKYEVEFLEGTEILFFDSLLESPKIESKFYRYSSLESAFMTINSKKFMFSGIVGMNDITEVDYVENYLFKRTIEDHKKHWKHIESLNMKYIMSCTTLEDDLTFWRLYGDDFQGASLEMNLLENNSNFIIKKVSYADRYGKDKILEPITEFYNYIYNNFRLKLMFKNIDTWKHFFKPYDYSVEKEVRILYKGDIKDERIWNLTYSHKILNPFAFVEMAETPFKLRKIYLGRKQVSCSTNEYQFKQLLRERSLNKDVDVVLSKITNYR